jgi:hypothetical protein
LIIKESANLVHHSGWESGGKKSEGVDSWREEEDGWKGEGRLRTEQEMPNFTVQRDGTPC